MSVFRTSIEHCVLYMWCNIVAYFTILDFMYCMPTTTAYNYYSNSLLSSGILTLLEQ